MLKKQEIDNLESCLNKAATDEPLFVLRGKDITAGATVRTWADFRIAVGKNKPEDAQIVEARAIADAMDAYAARRAIEAKTETPHLNPAAAWPFPASKNDQT